jgi:hypothetical protein
MEQLGILSPWRFAGDSRQCRRQRPSFASCFCVPSGLILLPVCLVCMALSFPWYLGVFFFSYYLWIGGFLRLGVCVLGEWGLIYFVPSLPLL